MNASQVSNANLTKFNNNHTNFLGHMNDYTLESKNLFSQDDTNTLDKYNKVNQLLLLSLLPFLLSLLFYIQFFIYYLNLKGFVC